VKQHIYLRKILGIKKISNSEATHISEKNPGMCCFTVTYFLYSQDFSQIYVLLHCYLFSLFPANKSLILLTLCYCVLNTEAANIKNMISFKYLLVNLIWIVQLRGYCHKHFHSGGFLFCSMISE
jgi:hypothetical protein